MIDFWVTLELSRLGEKERPEDLKDLLLQEMPDKDLDIFIPATSFFRRDNAVTVCVLEGYAFVRGGHPAGLYFDFESSPYVSKVLSRDEPTGRYLLYVSESDIQRLRIKLREQASCEIDVGDAVTVTEGAYENLTGVVVGLSPDGSSAYVQIDGLVSIDTYVDLPLQFLMRS